MNEDYKRVSNYLAFIDDMAGTKDFDSVESLLVNHLPEEPLNEAWRLLYGAKPRSVVL